MGETYRSGQSVNRLARPKVIALALATSALLLVTATALAATGDLTQPAGTAGCVSEDGTGPCADGHGLIFPFSVAVSPDGKSVYVAGAGAVARLNRNPTTGAISQPAGAAGCVSEDDHSDCADGHGLGAPMAVVVSPDGKSVYVASLDDAVARFNRNTTTGAISQPAGSAGCVSDEGAGPCANGHALDAPSSVAVSPDGKAVYVASQFSDAVARLDRNTTTGAISQPGGGCISESGAGGCADGHALNGAARVEVSPDGKNAYATSYVSDALARLNLNGNANNGVISQPAGTAGCVSRTGSGGHCADGHALNDPFGVEVSPDGKSVYVASSSSDAVSRFNRNTTAGAISQPAGTAGCVSETGAGTCTDGRALDGAGGVAVSPDGKSVYVASGGFTPDTYEGGALARLNRSTTTGAITQPAGTAGCVSENGFGPCANGHGLGTAQWVAVSPDGGNVYVASAGSSAVARFNRAP